MACQVWSVIVNVNCRVLIIIVDVKCRMLIVIVNVNCRMSDEHMFEVRHVENPTETFTVNLKDYL